MLLTSVIIVLREILEAALLIATLLAATRLSNIGYAWLRVSISSGIVGALVFAWQLRALSNLYNGVGYELINAALQVLIYGVIIVLIALLFRLYFRVTTNNTPLAFFMGFALCLSIIREGSEILIFFSGFLQSTESLSSGILGSIIGASVGFSFGALFYFLLSALKQSVALVVTLSLLILVGAGMCSQASQLLMQADFLPSQRPLWNTSSLISESSIPGQLLYALIGYEATPSLLQVSIYTGSIFISLIAAVVSYKVYSRMRNKEESNNV
ncbi:hypothetical protein A9Q88_04965 [Gammaproteobacteria bacterium 50_400_T64]|nr:hypothetical protein A9Q88_04965 [Gammaproteobacteria bacterium 50_400_T64]